MSCLPKKKQCSVALSPDVIDFIQHNRGSFSFSAYLEYLARLGVETATGVNMYHGGQKGEPRRAVVRVR